MPPRRCVQSQTAARCLYPTRPTGSQPSKPNNERVHRRQTTCRLLSLATHLQGCCCFFFLDLRKFLHAVPASSACRDRGPFG